ncbi:T9SS type A sorting domain-containing protein [Polaribacter sp. Z022]|uniref:T9SS type A sorting domain-containing protein n=1 Tax=Polaribacter sp. Z022 TaxID=2927125 RepID=UPI00201FEAB3|nr:T9SS type A sorting domain-containing protein [Polaribacter sp. Z022]MCL7754588.1 T9SS type A sorting domain-containing protein [Polaribacter sp. Z022]
MNILNKYILIFILLKSVLSFSQIDNEANFYTPIANANYHKNLVTDYNVDINFATDDSSKTQTAIDDISTNGGGVLTIPSGNYSLGDINLKSNVHIKIDENAVIRPFYEIPSDGKLKNYAIFKLGSNTNPIQNISITSLSNNRFTVDLTNNNNPNVAVVNCQKVTNFKIANFNVLDSYTKFSAVTTGGDDYNGSYLFPKNGVVKDIDVQNAHYGYGVVQTQSAENMLFKDLSGTGGATLRLETGFTGLNNLQGSNLSSGVKRIGGIHKMVARNISCTNGNSALMVSPHAMHNGTVDAEGIHSISAGFAVRVEAGFISNKYDQTIGLTVGTFEQVRIKNVTATYGEKAEIKSKHFNYYPSEITPPTTVASYINENETKVYVGASIASVLADANYTCTNGVKTVIVEEPINGTGFLYQEDIIPAEYLTIDCSTLSNSDKGLKESLFNMYPNPTSNSLYFRNVEGLKSVALFTLSGTEVIKLDKLRTSVVKLDLSNLAKGMYIVKCLIDDSYVIKKIILK